ncbi:DUF805 domain-containing protein [Moraxella sp. ZJ142]|uniref:DUF805 domain-containing protein n=1 Tax=Moraxella marmotae TaxID=3344520 RepID=UPI0035D4CF20
MRWFLYAFRHIFDYRGRARRAEYGWFLLISILISFIFQFVVSFGAALLAVMTDFGVPDLAIGILIVISGLLMIACGIASHLVQISLTARRLHDLGWSGWWQLVFYLGPCSFLFWLWLLPPQAVSVLESGNYSEELSASFVLLGGCFVVCMVAMLVISLILIFKDGQRFTNKYGADPKAVGEIAAD